MLLTGYAHTVRKKRVATLGVTHSDSQLRDNKD